MTVPTKQEFLNFVQLLATEPVKELADDFKPALFRAADPSEGAILVGRVLSAFSDHYTIIDKDPVMMWLNNQATFDRAFDKAFSVRRKKADRKKAASPQDFASLMLGRLREAASMEEILLREIPDDIAVSMRLYRHTRFGSRVAYLLEGRAKFFIDFVSEIVTPLIEYYFQPAAAIGIANRRRNLEQTKSDSLRALKQLKSTLDDEFLLRAFQALPVVESRSKKLFIRQIDLLIKDMSELAEVPAELAYPITRADSTCRERLLAYRLWKANRRQFKNNKTEVVFALLQLEGVEPIDNLRAVERWCAQFLDESRQLYAAKDKSSDVSVKPKI